MKLFALGLDGGDKRIIEHMPMPFLQSLIKQSEAPKIQGDLFGRGWPELYTGKDALETSGMYISPKLDGTYKFSMSFNHKQPSKYGCKPLWETLNTMGYSVGFMNLPTTSPAVEVNGFFVGGAGGGLNKLDSIPASLCDNEGTRKILEENNYIPDLRVGPGMVDTFTEMVSRLDEIIERRKESYLKLCEIHRPDFGFLCFRTNTTLQYFAMSEIEAIIAAKEISELPGSETLENSQIKFNRFQKLILEHFKHLDSVIEEIFSKISPSDFVLCADHGTVPYKYNANVNSFLAENNLLFPQSPLIHPFRKLTNRLWRKSNSYFPKLLKRLIRSQKAAVRSRFLPLPFNPSNTKAFGHWYCDGIYINDYERFGGPVRPAEIPQLVDEICEIFNKDNRCLKYKMKAVPLRREYQDKPFSDKLPDIKIEKPDEMFFMNKGDFVSVNPYFGPIPENLAGRTDMNSGQKSRIPLFEASPAVCQHIQDGDKKDIPLVHEVILRYFRNQG